MFVQPLLADCHFPVRGELLQYLQSAGLAPAEEKAQKYAGTGNRDGKPYSKVHKEVGHGRYIT
jgi:hypothetical protein